MKDYKIEGESQALDDQKQRECYDDTLEEQFAIKCLDKEYDDLTEQEKEIVRLSCGVDFKKDEYLAKKYFEEKPDDLFDDFIEFYKEKIKKEEEDMAISDYEYEQE